MLLCYTEVGGAKKDRIMNLKSSEIVQCYFTAVIHLLVLYLRWDAIFLTGLKFWEPYSIKWLSS